MRDYTKLVEALRGMDTGDSCPCEYYMMYVSDEKFCRNCGADMRKMEVQE